jgi:hypothetical protein
MKQRGNTIGNKTSGKDPTTTEGMHRGRTRPLSLSSPTAKPPDLRKRGRKEWNCVFLSLPPERSRELSRNPPVRFRLFLPLQLALRMKQFRG